MASNAAISTINNQGNLGKVFKEVTSRDALKGYATSAVTAGVTAGWLDNFFGVDTDHINHISKGFDLSTASGITKFVAYLGTQGTVQALTQTAFQGGSLKDNLKNSLTDELYHLLQATAFNAVGDFAGSHHWQDGSPEKIALHAVVGGLLSEATGGDFKTGALTAGANEALTDKISSLIKADPQLELAVSQMIGVAAATLTEGDINQAAQLAKNATSYNRQLHPDEVKEIKKLADAYAEEQDITPAEAEARLLAQAQREVDREFYETHTTSDVRAQAFLKRNAHTRLNKDGQEILIFTPGSPELYNDPTVYAQTWKDYSAEYQSMLNAAPAKTLAQHNKEIVGNTTNTALKGIGKGAANYPSDTVNGLLNLPVQIIYPLIPNQEQEGGIKNLFQPIEFIPVPFAYNNEIERDVGNQTQHIIDVGLAAAGAKKVLPEPRSFMPFSVDSGQLGKKLGKHVQDFGGNPANPTDRKIVIDKIYDIALNPDRIVSGTFSGQGANGMRGNVFFRIKGTLEILIYV